MIKPNVAAVYVNRALAYRHKGDFAKAIHDYEQATLLDSKHSVAHNNLAWLLATCANPAFRNGKRAVQLSRQACELLQWSKWNYIGTLAAAYADIGNFQEAIKWQRKSLEMNLPEAAVAPAQQRLSLYEQNKPYHEQE
ncbi:MAG TPA: tetratricopeptide repeat protein [Verrucomicrobiae bacterium]|nr:tetratricopeptide repeat protein [Verrucomicrobiae bacterium]